MTRGRGWDGQERRDNAGLSEEQIEKLTDAVSGRLEGRLYVAIGKAAFRALLLLAGALGAGALAWAGLVDKLIGLFFHQ